MPELESEQTLSPDSRVDSPAPEPEHADGDSGPADDDQAEWQKMFKELGSKRHALPRLMPK